MDQSMTTYTAAVACPVYLPERSLDHLKGFVGPRLPENTDLLVLPMRCVNVGAAQEIIAGLSAWAAQLKTHLVANLDAEPKSNVSILFGPDGSELGRYQKTHALPYEDFTLGNSLPVFETGIGRIGMIAGTDHYFPEVMEVMALEGADFIAWSHEPEPVPDAHVPEIKMRARGVDDNLYIVCADYAPDEEFRPSYLTAHRYGKPTGRSYVATPLGDLAAVTAYEPGVALAMLQPRHKRNVWHNIRGITPGVDPAVWAPLCEPANSSPMTERKKRVKVAIINSWHRDLFHNPETGEPLQVVNPDSLMTQVEAAAETGADLLALSEYFEIDDAIRDRLSEIARKHGCYISAAGWGENPQFFALLFGRDGAVIGRYDVVTDGGREFPVFDTEIGRIAFKVCRDIKEQELDRAYGLKQVDILLWPTLASGPSGELLLLKDRGRAIDNGFHVISSHLISSDTGLYSTIVDHNGNVVFAVPWYEEGVFVHELILCDQGWFDPQLMVEGFLTNWPKHQVAGWPERVPEFRRDFRAVKLACRRPELYGPIMTADRSAHKH